LRRRLENYQQKEGDGTREFIGVLRLAKISISIKITRTSGWMEDWISSPILAKAEKGGFSRSKALIL